MLIAENNVTSPRVGYWLLQGIALLRSPGAPYQLDAWLQSDWGTGARTYFQAASGLKPAFYAAFKDGYTLVILDGATTQEQADALVGGWVNSTNPDTAMQTNNFVSDLTAAIGIDLSRQGFTVAGNMNYAGYSMGGLLAEQFVYTAANQVGFGVTQRCWTFGTPRYAGSRICSALSAAGLIIRWMNDEDPVPLLPPRLSECPALPVVYGTSTIARFGRYCHSTFGLSVSPTGVVTQTELPPGASVNFVGSFARWYFSQITEEGNVHSLRTYTGRLGGLANAQAPPPPLPDRTREQPAVVTAQEVERAATRVENNVRTIERTQNAAILAVPHDRVCVAVRRGRIWYVQFGGVDICCPGTRRRARGVARQLNNFLLNLQTVAVVDPSTLLTQLGDYLDLATDPASGFRPTMNTTV